MARKAKTNGESPKIDPESEGLTGPQADAEGIRPADVEKNDDDSPAAPAPSDDQRPAKDGIPADPAKAGTPVDPEEGPPTRGDAEKSGAAAAPASEDPFAQPEPPVASARPAVRAATPARRSAWPMALAGVFTTALGFAAAYSLMQDGGPLAGTRLAEAESRLAELEAGLTEARAALASAEAGIAKAAPKATTEGIAARLSAAEARLDAAVSTNAEALAALSAKVEDLRQRPAETDPAATAAYERELAAMREMLDAELARIRAVAAEASAAETAAAEASTDAEILAALSALDAALDSGGSFGAALDQLALLAPALSLDEMRGHAEGVTPLAMLQADFPDVARAAIEADIAAGNGEAGIGGFLKGQLGMRSLAPKDGDSADAVLSRAEAKLRAGDLAGAVKETQALTGPAAEALAPWRRRADRRLAALTAFEKLSDEVRSR